jgi:hypothetical protein
MRILAGTLNGVATLSRQGPNQPWTLARRSLDGRHVGALVFEPGSGRLFAGAHGDGGLWVSDDGRGTDWRQLTAGLDRPHIYALSARRVGARVTLFLGTSPAGLYRSDDLGETWRELAAIHDVPDSDKWTFPPPPHIAHVKDIVFHPREAATLYVLVEQGGLLKSTDDGESFIELAAYSTPEDSAYRDAHRLLIDEVDPDLFHLAAGEGLYRSTDGGETWQHLTRRDGEMGYPDFLFRHPDDRAVLYMAGSHRNPMTWYEEGMARALIMRSTDGGTGWTPLDRGFPDPVIGAFEAMSLHHWPGGMTLLIGTATGEVYASEDGGDNWTCIAEDLTPISKDTHYVPFLPAEERARVEEILDRGEL